MAIEWPLRPNGKPVPDHRKSREAYIEGYPIFIAASYRVTNVSNVKVAHWECGYCERVATDRQSPHERRGSCLVDCNKCGKTNRIIL